MRRPFWILLLILLALGGLAAWEFPNYLRRPALRSHVFETDGCRIDLFLDGVRPRETAVFFRSEGREILLDRFEADGESLVGRRFGSLRWTRDRRALVATMLMEGGIESDELLWVFDTKQMVPIPAAGREAFVTQRGGLGERVFSWFDLGREGRYLFTWEADRWRHQVERLMELGM